MYIHTAFWLFKQRAGWLLKDPRHVPDDDYVRGDTAVSGTSTTRLLVIIFVLCAARPCVYVLYATRISTRASLPPYRIYTSAVGRRDTFVYCCLSVCPVVHCYYYHYLFNNALEKIVRNVRGTTSGEYKYKKFWAYADNVLDGPWTRPTISCEENNSHCKRNRVSRKNKRVHRAQA